MPGMNLPFKGILFDGLTNAVKGLIGGVGAGLPSKLIRVTCNFSSKDVSVSCEISSQKYVSVICALDNV